MKITTYSLLLCLITVAGLNLPLRGQPVQPPAPSGELELKRSSNIDDKMFPDGISHDFGKVQRGTPVVHVFRMVNTSKYPCKILSIRVSMSPLRIVADKCELALNEEADIRVTMDTRQFVGSRTFTIYVLVDNGGLREHRLCLAAESLENFAVYPERFDFGPITRGDTPTKHMIVAVPDQPNLKVTAATCASKFVQIKLQELGRGPTTAIYKVSATLQADIPEGETHETVELTTDNPAMPKLVVPLRVVVEAAK